ncbi:MAG TPA: glycosyl hydrolase family 28 protein, partial [Verrucomicrobiae bacterium]|nr:glycosyl hydrolase family 28 protein [Verrucomicrobiae bacterium]
MKVLLLTGLLVSAALQQAQAASVRTWPMPDGEAASGDFKVEADGQPVFVCVTHVAPADAQRRWKAMDDIPHSGDYFDVASFASFDMSGPVKTIRVTYREEVKEAKILPTSYGIVPKIEGRQVTFRLEHPANLTIECNGETTSSLHLFANPPEAGVRDVESTNTIYFGPGIHEVTNTIRVASGQTLYLAGGCVLRGMGRNGPVIEMTGSHVALRGRGIIDGSECPTHSRNLLYIHADDVTVEGVILRDSSTWNVPIRRCHGVLLDNVKVFGCRANSDGFDICNSSDVTVDGCFLRTLDDLIVVKSDRGQGPVHHVVTRNCVLWNQVAHALSVGAEL